MKKSIIYSFVVMAAVFFACEPIVERDPIGDPITADQLNVSATAVVVNGKKSNKIVLENHSPVNSSWNYGLSITNKACDTVLMVVTGTSKIVFTGLNPDGSKITKELSVTVDELSFPVAPEWGQLCGSGEKKWVWDAAASAVWGNGGYKGCAAPCWWTVSLADIGGQDAVYGSDGYMIFSLNGSSLTKSNAAGSKKEVGGFSFNMSKIKDDGAGGIWAKGKLNTKGVAVLAGFQPNNGNAPVYEYDILKLDQNNMVLSFPEGGDGAGAWSTAWFWLFSKAN